MINEDLSATAPDKIVLAVDANVNWKNHSLHNRFGKPAQAIHVHPMKELPWPNARPYPVNQNTMLHITEQKYRVVG